MLGTRGLPWVLCVGGTRCDLPRPVPREREGVRAWMIADWERDQSGAAQAFEGESATHAYAASFCTIACFGASPVIRSTSRPFLKISIVGIASILNCDAVRGFSSV